MGIPCELDIDIADYLIRSVQIRRGTGEILSRRCAHLGGGLMLPPTFNGRLMVNLYAPISQWEHYASYDSAAECESDRHYVHQVASKFTTTQRAHPTTLEESVAAQYIYGECTSRLHEGSK